MPKEKLLWSEYEYTTPPVPKDKMEIIGHDLPKKEQYWRKPRIPTDATWQIMSPETRYKLVERERYRRRYGVWFYNKGVPTYITPKHYDHMVYSTFDYKVKYLDTQRHDFYFRDLIEKDPMCYGGLVIKPRRYGYTDMEVTDHICTAIDNFFANCGMMSDTRDKVYSTLYDKITASYVARPRYVRPEVLMRNGMIPKRKMEFQTGKVGKAKSKNDIAYNMIISMNSKIVPKALSVMGYDGDKLKKLTLDEIWKWTKAAPKACWNKQKKCLFAGGTVIGKAMLLSTMGDDESYDKAIKEGIEMWHESSRFDRDLNGFTKTGLYRYFVPGWAALFDTFCDKYGFIDVKGATQYIMNERAKYEEGSLDLTYEMRKYPLTIEEALGTALSPGVFDRKRVDDTLTIIKNSVVKPYVEGELIEDNMGRIHWESNKNGPWVASNLPYMSTEEGIDRSNRWRKHDNRIIAPLNPEGVFGYDPIRYADTDVSSGSLSQACIIGRYKFDYFRPESKSVAGERAAMYLHRPGDAYEGHHEAIKAAKFWGFLIQYERQVESFIQLCRMPDVQFTDFVMRGQHGLFGLWTDNQRKVIKDGIDRIQKRFREPKLEGDIDWLKKEPFPKYLDQVGSFDPKKTTKFDAIMADIMCEDGLSKLNFSEIKNESAAYGTSEQIDKLLYPKRGRQ
jgi:hypothetical protein